MEKVLANVQYEYAISNDTGKSVHISEVEKKGLACNCICPKCKTRMIAKLGIGTDKGGRTKHFAHEAESFDCDPRKVNESLLHLRAKEIIAENRRIMLPGFDLNGDEDPNCNL